MGTHRRQRTGRQGGTVPWLVSVRLRLAAGVCVDWGTTHTLTDSSAPPPILLRSDGTAEFLDQATDPSARRPPLPKASWRSPAGSEER
jgi:hypothetical protein